MTARSVKPYSCFQCIQSLNLSFPKGPWQSVGPDSAPSWPGPTLLGDSGLTGCPSGSENTKRPSVTISPSPSPVIHSAWLELPSLAHSPSAHLPPLHRFLSLLISGEAGLLVKCLVCDMHTYRTHATAIFPWGDPVPALHRAYYYVLLLFFCLPILCVSPAGLSAPWDKKLRLSGSPASPGKTKKPWLLSYFQRQLSNMEKCWRYFIIWENYLQNCIWYKHEDPKF